MEPVIERMPEIGVTRISYWIFNCYLVHDGGAGTPFVVDAGLSIHARAVLDEAVREMGWSPFDITHAVATHGHSDHVAGLPHLHAHTRCEVGLPTRIQDYADGEEPRTPGPKAVARIVPVAWDQPFEWRALKTLAEESSDAGYGQQGWQLDVPTTSWLADGDTLPGAPDWLVLHTPGHTDDSTSFYNESTRTLLSGDAVLAVGRRGWFNPEFTDVALSADTEERLRALEVEWLLPGHGRPVGHQRVLDEAMGHLERPRDEPAGLRRWLRSHRR